MKRIHGEKVNLQSAKPEDKRPIYEWLANSNLTHQMMGPPDFSDNPIPSRRNIINDDP
jgi:hypothetical protein